MRFCGSIIRGLHWTRRRHSVCFSDLIGAAPVSPSVSPACAMRLLFALLFSCISPLAKAGDQPSAPDLSSYPQTEAFLHFVGMHTNAAEHTGHLLAVTEFIKLTGSNSEAWVYWLGESGSQHCEHEFFPEFG